MLYVLKNFTLYVPGDLVSEQHLALLTVACPLTTSFGPKLFFDNVLCIFF